MSASRSRRDLFSFSRPFFHEVVKLHTSLADGAVAASGHPADIAARVRAIQESLLTLLRSEIGAAPRFDECRYLLAAFADDRLTSIRWAGEPLWHAEPLAAMLYQDRSASMHVFERVGALLQRDDPADAALATVYLAALALGFVGPYRPPNDAPLRRYKEDLAFFVARHDPAPAAYSRHLFPNAYAHTARGGSERADGRALSRWTLAAAAAGLFLLVSHLVWLWLTHDLSTMTDRILAAAYR